MALGRNILGGILTLFGGIWFLQGISVLPGTFMRGSSLWTVIGAVTCLVGLAVLTVGRQRPNR
jgi:drug/metabolite transporter superfamily protein YnfA